MGASFKKYVPFGVMYVLTGVSGGFLLSGGSFVADHFGRAGVIGGFLSVVGLAFVLKPFLVPLLGKVNKVSLLVAAMLLAATTIALVPLVWGRTVLGVPLMMIVGCLTSLSVVTVDVVADTEAFNILPSRGGRRKVEAVMGVCYAVGYQMGSGMMLMLKGVGFSFETLSWFTAVVVLFLGAVSVVTFRGVIAGADSDQDSGRGAVDRDPGTEAVSARKITGAEMLWLVLLAGTVLLGLGVREPLLWPWLDELGAYWGDGQRGVLISVATFSALAGTLVVGTLLFWKKGLEDKLLLIVLALVVVAYAVFLIPWSWCRETPLLVYGLVVMSAFSEGAVLILINLFFRHVVAEGGFRILKAGILFQIFMGLLNLGSRVMGPKMGGLAGDRSLYGAFMLAAVISLVPLGLSVLWSLCRDSWGISRR